MMPPRLRCLVLAAGIAFAASTAGAQVSAPDQERVRIVAERIAELMSALDQRATEYPAFIAELEAGLVSIEQADDRVRDLIEQLTTATDEMEDGGDLDTAIDNYVAATTDLIAEAEASNNDAMKEAIPELEAARESLRADDARRAETVIEARNLIRLLERNREAIAFFIRAGQVQRAADLIRQHVDEFEAIVENGKALAEGIVEASNP